MKVSVIIPVFNAAPFLDKCIQSALDQPQTGEVILIDDRSTDESLVIYKKWERVDSRVKVFVNEGTKGAGAARNVGLCHANCAYIAFLDADDYYLEGRFDVTSELFSKFADAECVSESVKIRINHTERVKTLTGDLFDGQIIGCKDSFSKISLDSFLLKNNFLITGITIKNRSFVKVGNFDVSLIQTQDTDLLIRILNSCIVYSGEYTKPVVAYFIHETNRIHNFYDAAYYRRKLMKKHILSYKAANYSIKTIMSLFFKYIEYEYLLMAVKPKLQKKIVKMVLLPIFFIRLFSKNDYPYNPNQKIH